MAQVTDDNICLICREPAIYSNCVFVLDGVNDDYIQLPKCCVCAKHYEYLHSLSYKDLNNLLTYLQEEKKINIPLDNEVYTTYNLRFVNHRTPEYKEYYTIHNTGNGFNGKHHYEMCDVFTRAYNESLTNGVNILERVESWIRRLFHW